MRAHAEAPCTVGNCGPGFDALSLALERRGDVVRLEVAGEDSVTVTGPGASRVPSAWNENSACASLDALRHQTGRTERLRVVIEKGMPPGSGLGSSASSNAAAVRAFARLTGVRLAPLDALRAAAYGESVATGSAHHDDVAAALFGGLVIVGGPTGREVLRVRPPPVTLVVARPEVELPTREMRRLIPDALPKAAVVGNLGNVARLVHACHTQDGDLFCRSLEDGISRPYRAPRVPRWDEARAAALEAGALGFLLSGSGPAMIAAVPPSGDAAPVERALRSLYGGAADVFLTKPLAEVIDDALPLP